MSPCAGWTVVACMMLCAALPAAGAGRYAIPLTVTSELPLPNVPMDPEIDFARAIADAGLPGVLDANSIEVIDAQTGDVVPHALGEGFRGADRCRVQWLIASPEHTRFEIRFGTADERPPLAPARHTPRIGTGDLLRYNAGEPRPVTAIGLCGLVDLTGDGRADLVGCWNYAWRPGEPWDGVFCFPRMGGDDALEVADPVRLRSVDEPGSREFHDISRVYMHADLADLDGDGLPDLVYSPSGGDEVHVFGNSGQRDAGGMPVFVAAGSVPRGTEKWSPCRAVDLDGDGAIDLVVGGIFLRNTNPDGWPLAPAEPVAIDAGDGACFLDVDGDGLLDAVCLVPPEEGDPRAKRVAWRRNQGGDPPSFGPSQVLADIDCWWCTAVAPAVDGERRGIIVGHDLWQQVTFFEQMVIGPEPRFRRAARAESLSAVLSLSDQAWPCMCDWDGDGDLDLLVGGGYGWPRIVINEGTTERPAFAEAQPTLADGEPIRILRDEVLGGEHWHNMGYPYPVFVDWDGDGLPDLMLPNETNRIFWYRNIGTRAHPRFGARRQVICDGYPDGPEQRARSAQLAGDRDVPNHPYPYEETRPFFWRTGAGFADLNGDGLMDMVTLDGFTRRLTLFAQYRDGAGELRLRKDGPLRLMDGREIDDSVVGRSQHWTERFVCVDWDGDGLIDIVYSCAGSDPSVASIFLLRNCGTPGEPVFEPPVTLCCLGEPIKITNHGPHPWVGDLTGDGRPDILACVEWSVYPFFSHAAIVMPRRTEFVLGTVRPVRVEGQ